MVPFSRGYVSFKGGYPSQKHTNMFHGKVPTFETVNFGDLIWFRLNSLKSALEDFTLAVEGRNATGKSESDRIFKGFYMFWKHLKQNTRHFVSFFFIWYLWPFQKFPAFNVACLFSVRN